MEDSHKKKEKTTGLKNEKYIGTLDHYITYFFVKLYYSSKDIWNITIGNGSKKTNILFIEKFQNKTFRFIR